MKLKKLSIFSIISNYNRQLMSISLAILCSDVVSAAEMPMALEADAGRNLYATIEKLSNNFYSGRIPDKNLTLVMERVDEQTHPFWLAYANRQTYNAVLLDKNERNSSTGNGSWHFQRVLEHISCKDNEIWIAYITRTGRPRPIVESIKDSTNTAAMDIFAKDIEMFVTVTSSPKAFITSHMGIAATVESANNRTKGTSIDLHSFAAKVMLMRNPKRKFMVNAPVYAMEKILKDALPHSVYIGTKELCEALENRLNLSFEEFKAAHLSFVSKSDEECVVMMKYKIYKNLGYSRPYYLTPEEFLSLIKKHPPIISTDPPLIFDPHLRIDRCLSKKSENEVTRYNFTIFNPKNPTETWLSIDNENHDYQWIFKGPFIPANGTHYIVVDLVDLANCRPIA